MYLKNSVCIEKCTCFETKNNFKHLKSYKLNKATDSI